LSAHGIIDKFEATLFVQDFNQKKACAIVFIIISIHNLDVQGMEVKTWCLNGDIVKDIYISNLMVLRFSNKSKSYANLLNLYTD